MDGSVIIYGGSGAIGSAVARRMAAAGRRVHLAGRDVARLGAIAAETGGGFTVADVTEEEGFARVTADAGEAVAGLVYAVGTINMKPLGRLSDADFQTDFAVNALGAARAIQAALPALRAAGAASVVLFSTVAVGQGFAAHASIGMAKGAVEGLTRALAAELAPGIRVNAVAPSLTRTPLASALTSSAPMASAIAGMHALQRLGEPDDIAAAAAFLLSADASWITGQVIGVDGGRSTLRTKG